MKSWLITILPIWILFFIFAANAHAGSEVKEQPTNNVIYVEVTGEVPGFTQAKLSQYLADQMQKSDNISWHFLPNVKGSSPNRIVWKFRVLNAVWKGGTHMGFPSPSYSMSYLKAEAKLYLNGEYQMTIDTHPSALSGDEDQSIAEMARQVVHTFFMDSQLQ